MAKAGRGSDFLNERCVGFSLFLERLQVRNTIPPIKRKWIHVNRYFLWLGQLIGVLICWKFLECVLILLSENSLLVLLSITPSEMAGMEGPEGYGLCLAIGIVFTLFLLLIIMQFDHFPAVPVALKHAKY